MHECIENLESLVARSTLVATAGEFIPRAYSSQRTASETNRQESSQKRQSNSREFNQQRRVFENSQRSDSDRRDGRSWRDGNRNGGRPKENRRDKDNHQNGGAIRNRQESDNMIALSRNRQEHENGGSSRIRKEYENAGTTRDRNEHENCAPPRQRREYESSGPSRHRKEYENNSNTRNRNDHENGWLPPNRSKEYDNTGPSRYRKEYENSSTSRNGEDHETGVYSRSRQEYDSAGTNRGRQEYDPTQRVPKHVYNDEARGSRSKPSNLDRFRRQKSYENTDEDQKQIDSSQSKSISKRNFGSRQYNNRQNFENPRSNGVTKKRYEPRYGSNEIQEGGKNQMEALVSLLTKGELECLVCYEQVKQTQSTWSCSVCHHVLHLRCVGKWARSSRADQVWRCPACRHVFDSTPTDYLCFCGKTADPVWNRSDCPHSCGSNCGLARADPCPHRCTLSCHPGPCPPCGLFVTRTCGCGRASRTVQCADQDPVVCGSPCGRVLNCSYHKCGENCHAGECPPCAEIINQVCFCGKTEKGVPCTEDSVKVEVFCCGETCNKQLSCGNHNCSLICHSDPCLSCPLLPENVFFCPCGQTAMHSLNAPQRVSCLEPLPTCSALCGKLLPCGEPGNRHQCTSHCHEGACPPCADETTIRCRCGHMNKTILCAELPDSPDDVRCEKKCNKRRSCGKHKCREPCCIDVDHLCALPCTRTLSCNLHRCEEPCHSAYCKPCPRMSFDELPCECGAEVIYPPVPCGVRRPQCSQVCSRRHDCNHQPSHNCHSDPNCPPCTVLIAKRCHGGHEIRKAVPCHMDVISCGLPCGRPMPCGRHTCILPCHSGPCLKDDTICNQPCTTPRSPCGHYCGAPCHDALCPDGPCKETVRVTCECGHRFSTRSCVENSREYQRIATIQLATKMADLAAGQTIDLNICSKKISFKTLECSEECKIIERNRRLAVGLQIRNPDLSAKLTPRYSDFLRNMAKKDGSFCQMVHDKLTELVKLAKESKQQSRSYSFDPMKREKRQFIHEYCEHFGCESVAYDKEPHRNIVATALRDKSWLPGISLSELIQRESGARKVPLPNNAKMIPAQRSTMEVLSARGPSGSSTWAESSSQGATGDPTTQTAPQMDYFTMTPL